MKLWTGSFLAVAVAVALVSSASLSLFPPSTAWCGALAGGAAAALFVELTVLRRARKLRREVEGWTAVGPTRLSCPARPRDDLDLLAGSLNEALARLSTQVERTKSWGETVTESSNSRLLALEDALQRSEATSGQKTRFLASMSHELRTPIGAILGYAEVLEEERGGLEDRKNAVFSIRRNGEHLLELVNDILDLSKIEAGKLEIEPFELGLEKVLHDVISVMSVRAQTKGLRLEEIFLNPVPVRIVSDATRIRQVLINLVGNAVKFTERGLVTLAVSHTALDNEECRLDFRVQDTGIGIASEKLIQLFRPFQQVHSEIQQKYGGTGLGLVISKEIARLLGGDISVRSDVGLGSLFTFSIRCKLVAGTPFLRRPSSALLDDTRRLQAQSQDARLPPLSGHVLVVDDSPDNRKLFRYHLESNGVRVDVAENGKEAVTKGVAQKFDVILMDIQMPELDGFGALKELRARGVEAPIVALTAHAMRGDKERCLDAGFTAYLSKPVSRASLLEKLRELTKKPDDPAAAPELEKPADSLEAITGAFRASLVARALLLEEARANSDLEAMRLQIHTLKGTLGSMGFDELSALAVKAYQAIEEGGSEQALAAVATLEAACHEEGRKAQQSVKA